MRMKFLHAIYHLSCTLTEKAPRNRNKIFKQGVTIILYIHLTVYSFSSTFAPQPCSFLRLWVLAYEAERERFFSFQFAH